MANQTWAATTTTSRQNAINLAESMPDTHSAKRKKNKVEGYMASSNTNKHQGTRNKEVIPSIHIVFQI